MFPLNISRCLDANGAIVSLGNAKSRRVQRLSKESEGAANTAYQWHLLVDIQRTIVKEQLILERFLKLRYTPQLAGQIQGLRTMLLIDYDAVLSDGEKWFDANDPDVRVHLVLFHSI